MGLGRGRIHSPNDEKNFLRRFLCHRQIAFRNFSIAFSFLLGKSRHVKFSQILLDFLHYRYFPILSLIFSGPASHAPSKMSTEHVSSSDESGYTSYGNVVFLTMLIDVVTRLQKIVLKF